MMKATESHNKESLRTGGVEIPMPKERVLGDGK